MPGHVKGLLFADYVRMLRAHRGRTWHEFLEPEDVTYLHQEIDVDAWYPWRRSSASGSPSSRPSRKGTRASSATGAAPRSPASWGPTSTSSSPGDPRESLMRFFVLRRSLFDFEALSMLQLCDSSASIGVEYGMQPLAERAAAVQTMGFFEGLIALADGGDVHGEFLESSWRGDRQTIIGFTWQPAAGLQPGAGPGCGPGETALSSLLRSRSSRRPP